MKEKNMKEALRKLKEEMANDLFLSVRESEAAYKAAALSMKIYFDSLKEAGFTEEQALEIVKEHGYTPRG